MSSGRVVQDTQEEQQQQVVAFFCRILTIFLLHPGFRDTVTKGDEEANDDDDGFEKNARCSQVLQGYDKRLSYHFIPLKSQFIQQMLPMRTFGSTR
jgi:hypothetical protein